MTATIDRLDTVPGSKTSTRKTALERLFTRIGEVTALPHSSMQVIKLADDENSNVELLTNTIKEDPILSVQVLRQVNSSQYGLRNRVANLQMAISLLGFREVKNIALTVYVSKFFQAQGNYRAYSRKGLWRHSIVVANISQVICYTCGHDVTDDTYFAALLHDLGLILIDSTMRKHFCKILDRLSPSVETRDVEQELLTFDHTHLGAYVAEQWGLSPKIVSVMAHHHEPDIYEGPYQRVVQVVAAANYFASKNGAPGTGVDNVRYPGDYVFEELGLDSKACRTILEEIPGVIRRADAIAGTI